MSEEKTENAVKNKKADATKKGGCLKGCLTLFILLAILGGLISACFGGEDKDSSKQDKNISEEADKGSKEKTKEAKSSDDKLAKQKDYFIKNTQPAIDNWTKSYDQLWNTYWKPTFEAISKGSSDIYTAYDNMKALKAGYVELTLENSVPVEGLSKEQKKELKDAMDQLTYAAASRQMAAEKAMKMFDESNFSPSQMDKIKSDISASDSQLLQGVVGITKVKQELGLIEEVKK